MTTLKFKLVPSGAADGKMPLNLVMVDVKDIEKCGLSVEDAVSVIGESLDDPTAINVFDLEAVTTTSDGIMVDSAIIAIGASDKGRVHREYGYLQMAEIEYSEELIALEPHLKQWDVNYKGKRLFRGPNVADKKIPVHNVVISGRACNNNSGTEMMDLVTMNEIIMPYLGQKEIITDGDIIIGMTGEMISVGIGMTVMEKFGRVFSTRRYRAGDTAHGSGEYAKTLKANIPCIVADKKVLAEYTIKALQAGMIPGRDIGCSPAVLCLAKATGYPIDFDNITARAWAELESVGIDRKYLEEPVSILNHEQAILLADEIIPGVDQAEKSKAQEISITKCIEI